MTILERFHESAPPLRPRRSHFYAQHHPRSGKNVVNRDRRDAVRLGNAAAVCAGVKSGGRLQNAYFPAIGCKAQRTVAVVGIAVPRMARDDDGLALHRRCQVGSAAVVADEEVAALQHGADLAKRRAAQDDRLATQQLCQMQRLLLFIG